MVDERPKCVIKLSLREELSESYYKYSSMAHTKNRNCAKILERLELFTIYSSLLTCHSKAQERAQ